MRLTQEDINKLEKAVAVAVIAGTPLQVTAEMANMWLQDFLELLKAESPPPRLVVPDNYEILG